MPNTAINESIDTRPRGPAAHPENTLASTAQQRYLWPVGTNPEPEPGHSQDPALSRLYRLAEALASDIALREPDWCGIARDARALATAAQKRCEVRSYKQQISGKEGK